MSGDETAGMRSGAARSAGGTTSLSEGRRIGPAINEFGQALRAWPLWTTLAWQDIVHRFRRSVLGPFWITLAFGVMVAALGQIYPRVLHEPQASYITYLAIGLVLWNFVSLTLQDCAMAFVLESGVLWQTPVPLPICLFRVLLRNLIILGFNAIIVGLLIAFDGPALSGRMLMAAAGLVLLCLHLGWIGLVLAVLNTRYRDVSRATALVLQLALLVTPIIWRADRAQHWGLLVDLNPLFHGIELVRAPLLDQALPATAWMAATIAAVIGWAASVVLFAFTRRRVIYWL